MLIVVLLPAAHLQRRRRFLLPDQPDALRFPVPIDVRPASATRLGEDGRG